MDMEIFLTKWNPKWNPKLAFTKSELKNEHHFGFHFVKNNIHFFLILNFISE